MTYFPQSLDNLVLVKKEHDTNKHNDFVLVINI